MGTVRRDPSLADNSLLPGALRIGWGRLLSAAEQWQGREVDCAAAHGPWTGLSSVSHSHAKLLNRVPHVSLALRPVSALPVFPPQACSLSVRASGCTVAWWRGSGGSSLGGLPPQSQASTAGWGQALQQGRAAPMGSHAH